MDQGDEANRMKVNMVTCWVLLVGHSKPMNSTGWGECGWKRTWGCRRQWMDTSPGGQESHRHLACVSNGVATGPGQCSSLVLALLRHFQSWGQFWAPRPNTNIKECPGKGNRAAKGSGAAGTAEGAGKGAQLGEKEAQGPFWLCTAP